PEDRIYTVSLDKGLTYHSIHQQVLYAFGFLLTLILVNSRKRIILLLSSIMILGVVISFFSIAREIVNYLSPLSTAKHFPPITGTFINKNHFAAFLNMSISANIALILLVNQNSEYMGRGLVKIFNIALDWHKHLFLYLSILCIALVLTESRGAIASLTFAVAVVSLAVMLSTKAREWHSHNLKYLLIFGTVAIFAFGWGFLLSQLDGDNGSWAMRKALWTMTAEMAKDYWVFGAGAGVYELVFPVYNAGITGQNVVYTHNDYLQMLVEKGIFGLTLFILIILVALKSAFTEIFHSQNPAKCAFSIGATVAILSMSVHGFVDFNFNIPSNALYFYIFLALAITSGANSRIRTRAIHRHS
ncbi:MAG: O-antigen ligase family protein, partial [Gammaproteobacteria bacterium]|nr:O-antigen ligase family protein [Gammaproteobacteria bacterium]